MHNINLVCLRHQDCGNCNSIELHRIIEKIRPEVIFEELSYFNFEKAYNQKSLFTVETTAVNQYLLNHQIEHIPVDTYPLSDSYHKQVDQMLDKVLKGIGENSFQLRSLLERQYQYISQYGFKYLNSDYNDKFIEEQFTLRETILDELNDENSFRIYKLEKEMNEKLEVEILTNIYKYSSENPYQQGLMFIGSGHRKSIFKLIENFYPQEELKLNWFLW